MLDREWLAGAAQAGHDFVGDQESFVTSANFRDARGVAFGWNGGAESGADNGFEDESRSGGFLIAREKSLEVFGASELALRKCFFERAVIAEARSNVAPFGEERLVGCASRDVAADSHRTDRRSVVALPTGENAEARRLAVFEMKLASELDGCFGGLRAAGGEIDAAVFEIWRSQSEKASGEFFSGGIAELGSVGEGELGSLIGHSTSNFGNAVPNVDDGGLTGGVEEFAAVGGEEPRTFAADGEGKLFAKIAREKGGIVLHAYSGSDCSRVESASLC